MKHKELERQVAEVLNYSPLHMKITEQTEVWKAACMSNTWSILS